MTTTITREADPGIRQESDAESAVRGLEALRRCGYHVTILSPRSSRTHLYEVSAVGEVAGAVHLIAARAGHLHEAISMVVAQMGRL